MDGGLPIDLEALFTAIREQEHLVFRFLTIPERLFVDFRAETASGPAVFVLPPAASFKERVATIERVRPALPRPERINLVAWPLHVGALERLGVIAQVRVRLGDMDGFEALRDLDGAISELGRSERAEMRRAVTGEGYRTLWPAPVE